MKSILLFLLFPVLIFILPLFRNDESTLIVIDTTLKDGDLILRNGKGLFTKFYHALINDGMVHAGIISVEDDGIYVYHSEANERTLKGQVRKELLSDFLSFSTKIKIYRSQDKIINGLVLKQADSLFTSEVPFDIRFNSQDHSNLYCTEMIAYCYNLASKKEVIKPSLCLIGKRYYQVSDLIKNDFIVFKLIY